MGVPTNEAGTRVNKDLRMPRDVATDTPPDTLTPLIRRLNQSMLSLAAIGGALRLHGVGLDGDPAVRSAIDSALAALEAPSVAALSAEETQQALGLVMTFFAEARDLLESPEKPPGWAFDDPAILQGIGNSSAGLVDRMVRVAAERPWLGDALVRPGEVLDVGTGVGGIALAAAAAWPAKRVLGIDLWQPSLDLAKQNRCCSAVAERVTFKNQALQDLDEVARFDLVWVPAPFIPGAVVTGALPGLHRALRPGGALIIGVLPPPPDALGHALSRLRTIRNGGHPWSCAQAADLLLEHGFKDVEVPAGQAGIHFVLGRK
jgi:SAM-dependent methyltransferase